ncbi:hypothetical protein AAF712_006981 [Marasmius tenuissimus]|uniref:Uncharacterized protein n=1 Tax=Marasmius tenuissimus TaxID=585030 RepID=A0ABR2ZY40_9AGAR
MLLLALSILQVLIAVLAQSTGLSWPSEVGPVIAIDFGSSYAQVGLAVKDKDHIEILKDGTGRLRIPTRVCFAADGTLAYGHACPDVLDGSVIHDILRYVNLISPPADGWERGETVLLDGLRDSSSQLLIPLLDVDRTPKTIYDTGKWSNDHILQVILGFLGCLQQSASLYYNQTITSALIVVPTSHTEKYRSALLSVAPACCNEDTSTTPIPDSPSSLQILRVVKHCVATISAHGLLENPEEQYTLTYYLDLEELVPFEVTASLLEDGVVEVLGSEHMDLEDRVEEWLLAELGRKVFPEVWGRYEKLQELSAVKENRLKEIARKARAELFSVDDDSVEVVFAEIGYPDISTILTKDIFYGLYRDLLFRTIDLSMKVLRSAAMYEHKAGIGNLDQIVLSGKSSTHPLIAESLALAFPNVTVISHSYSDFDSNKTGIRPETAAVIGAARHAVVAYSDYEQGCMGCFSISTMDISVELDDDVVGVIIPRNWVLPAQRTKRFNITTGDIRIHGGFGRYTNNTVLLGTLGPPPGEGEVTIKATIDSLGLSVEVEAQRDGIDGTTALIANIPMPDELWPEDEIIRLVDEAVEFDRKAREVVDSTGHD